MPEASVLEVLAESRRREKAQTLFYRALAAEAELGGRAEEAERLNALHADEQHHLSRLTARLLEITGEADDLAATPRPAVGLPGWEERARAREDAEIAWYASVLELDLDRESRAVVAEILESERRHREHLGGKWMPA